MNKLSITIRQEQPADYDEVYNLVREAFLPDNHTEEPDYLNTLRTRPEFVPELSLVAVTEDGTIAGQIAISRTVIRYPTSQDTQLTVSPLSVLPRFSRRGIGSALLREAMHRAGTLGYRSVFLWGNPDFYLKYGFVPAHRFNIYHAQFMDKDVPFILVYQLTAHEENGEKGIIDIF